MRVFFISLVVGCALGATVERPPRQVYGDRIDLQPSYLPPTGPAPCEPGVVYSTQVIYSTVVIPSTVYNNNEQVITQTEVRTEQIFTTAFSEIVSTQVVTSFQFQTVTVTRTDNNVRTEFITVPGQVNFVTRTKEEVRTQVQFQTQFTTVFQQVTTTITRNVFSTVVVPQQVISTIFQTQTVTRTQELPGQTRTIDSTRFSTVYSTIFVPGQDATRTETVVRTNFVTRTITQPGQTQVITSTQIIPLTSTVFSQIVITNTQTQFVTRTQVEQQVTTVFRTQQVPQFNTRTVTRTQQVVSTQFSTQQVRSTIFSQQVVPTVVNVPGQTQFRTVFRTVLRTQQLPGRVRTQFVSRIVYITNFVTSTVFNKQFHTITATRTKQPYCNTGYNYYGH